MLFPLDAAKVLFSTLFIRREIARGVEYTSSTYKIVPRYMDHEIDWNKQKSLIVICKAFVSQTNYIGRYQFLQCSLNNYLNYPQMYIIKKERKTDSENTPSLQLVPRRKIWVLEYNNIIIIPTIIFKHILNHTMYQKMALHIM